MEYNRLGHSGLRVPALAFGTATFGGGNEFFGAWGNSDVAAATRLVDICLEAGANLFDSADVYSDGRAEEILGRAIAGRRDRVLISTKATFRLGDGPNQVGSSRHHLLRSGEQLCRASPLSHRHASPSCLRRVRGTRPAYRLRHLSRG